MNGTEQISYIEVTGFPALLIILAIGFVAYGIPAMKIATRAGKPGWHGALMAIPIVNIVWIWVFAASRWPAEDDRGRRSD